VECVASCREVGPSTPSIGLYPRHAEDAKAGCRRGPLIASHRPMLSRDRKNRSRETEDRSTTRLSILARNVAGHKDSNAFKKPFRQRGHARAESRGRENI